MATEVENSNSPGMVRLDNGYLNAFMPSGIRGRMDNYSAEMMAGGSLLPQTILQSCYIHNGFARIICDTPAEEMTRAGFDIDGLSEDVEKTVNSKLEELDAVKHFNEAIKWRRAFGGGLIVLGLQDGGVLEEPLNEPAINAIEFMRVYDRYEAFSYQRYNDPADAKYGKIELWQVSPKSGGTSYLVHESRVLVFDGESVPSDIRVSNQGWGASVIQNCFKELMRLDSSYKWSGLLLERMQQAVHGIPDLSTQVADPQGEANIVKRLAIVDRVRSSLNTIAIDALETYEVKSMSLTGVKDILESHAEALSAASRIPTFILMGRTVGGLGGNGDSSRKGWEAQVESWQNDQIRKPLDRLISLILLVESAGSTDGGDYTIEFCPLSKMSKSECADVELKEAQAKKSQIDAIMVGVNGGLMDQNEGRAVIADEYELVGDAPEPVDEPVSPMVLNPGQKLVDPVAGQHNPAPPVGKPKAGKTK
ncbi:MAG: DUF1073 domain-containing protein [Pseudomonadota bacterium]